MTTFHNVKNRKWPEARLAGDSDVRTTDIETE